MTTKEINLTDLRTGNVLSYTTAEGDDLDTAIDWQDLKWLDEDPIGFNSVHKPTLVTEEWLQKLGFEWKNQGLRKDNICIRQFGFGFSIFMSNEAFNFNIDLKHVHQLQNLYFALTGKELKLEGNEGMSKKHSNVNN